MVVWLLWTAMLGLTLLGVHVGATSAPANWLMASQEHQPAADLLTQAEQLQHLQQELWPQCHQMLASNGHAAAAHPDKQSLAMCSEVHTLLAGLHQSCHAVHHCPQACLVLGLTPEMLSCPPDTPHAISMSSQPLTPSLLSTAKAHQQSWQQQQQYVQPDQGHFSPQQSGSSPSRATRLAEHVLLPDESLKATEAWFQESWVLGGMLSEAHRLWQHLIYDTQVVQKQLESEAQIGGQACRSCLMPHLHKSHREVVFEVVALLVLGALCASGLLVAASFYRRRQSTRRQMQNNIATQRLRHFEKLQQQQHQRQQRHDEEVRRSMEAPVAPAQIPLLHSPQPSPAVSVKHTRHRHKASEPTIPSSPSASSSHSEGIGTQVRQHSKSEKADKPQRARSAQRRVVNLATVDSLHHGLGRSQSDISTEAAQHAQFEMPEHSMQSVHSLEGFSLTGSTLDPPSQPSTPSSMAGSTTFNPFQNPLCTHQTPSEPSKPASAASVDGSTDSLNTKQAGPKRRNRHKSKAAKKSAPVKRRFIPGLDTKFDPAIHELPTPPEDPTPEQATQRAAVELVGSSHPSSSSTHLPDAYTRRQLSVDAPAFVPSAHSNLSHFGTNASQFPLTNHLRWQPQSAISQLEGQRFPTSYSMLHAAETTSGLNNVALCPWLAQASNPLSDPYPARVSPLGASLYRGDQVMQPPSPSVPKPSPRHSPTSVLPAHLPSHETASPYLSSSSSCGSSHTSFPFPTAVDQQPQLGLLGSPRGCGLPPLLEEDVGNPFPGMPCRVSERAFHPLAQPLSPPTSIFNATQNAASAAAGMPESPHVTIAGSLPGFNSIWSTAKSTDMHSSEDSWHSFTTNKHDSIW